MRMSVGSWLVKEKENEVSSKKGDRRGEGKRRSRRRTEKKGKQGKVSFLLLNEMISICILCGGGVSFFFFFFFCLMK
jgi:hypothetical protein